MVPNFNIIHYKSQFYINKHLICELLTGHYPGKEAPYGLKIRSM